MNLSIEKLKFVLNAFFECDIIVHKEVMRFWNWGRLFKKKEKKQVLHKKSWLKKLELQQLQFNNMNVVCGSQKLKRLRELRRL